MSDLLMMFYDGPTVVQVPMHRITETCTYRTTLEAIGGSPYDRCGEPATSSIKGGESEAYLFRCDKHRGQLIPSVTSEALDYVHMLLPTYKDVAEAGTQDRYKYRDQVLVALGDDKGEEAWDTLMEVIRNVEQIRYRRGTLNNAVAAALNAIDNSRVQLGILTSGEVYDVEYADSPRTVEFITDALRQAEIGLTAARHHLVAPDA